MRKLIAVLAVMALQAAPALAQDGEITVMGEGEVAAAPDMAVVDMGVTREAETAQQAMQAVGAAMSSVLMQLREQGLEDRDIQTSGLTLAPRWSRNRSPEDNEPEIVGFVASNMVTVRLRDLDLLGPVLSLVVEDGANRLGGLRFTVADPKPLMDEARRRAVADARRRAGVLAEAAGVTLGPLVSISESGGPGRPMPLARMEAAMMDAAPIAEGEVGLTSTVTMVYAIAE